MSSVNDIPYGDYCYKGRPPNQVNCPYWFTDLDHEEQCNGYCSYLKIGDWMDNASGLLWDQVKECDVNTIDYDKIDDGNSNVGDK